ncbi:MAG: L,D-transpeptidase family protein [Clostridiaceae bacterium]
MKRRFKIKILISVLILVVVWIASYKISQGKEYKKDVNLAFANNNYEKANKVLNEAKNDFVIEKIFDFDEYAQEQANLNFETLKQKYYEGKIDYETLSSNVEILSNLKLIDKDEIDEAKTQILLIEDNRQNLLKASNDYNEKNYEEAIICLSSVTDTEESIFEKAKDLEKLVYSDYKNKVIEEINTLNKDKKYENALKYLDEKVSLFSSDEIDNFKEEINECIKQRDEELKKQEEERQKAIANSENQTKAIYLSNYVENPEIESKVSNMTSNSMFLVWVNVSSQMTYAFINDNGKWKLIKEFVCATGKSGHDTPKGNFTITSRGTWFYSNAFAMGAEYWTSFYGDYLFHSVPMDINRNVVDETLGQPASHGCIRLAIDNAKWIYNNMSYGTKVYIS